MTEEEDGVFGASARWERLAASIETEMLAAAQASLRDDVADRTRFERGRVRSADRLAMAVGRRVHWQFVDGSAASGTVVWAGTDVVACRDPGGSEVLVALDRVASVRGVPGAALLTREDRPVLTTTLRQALAGLSRARVAVAVVMPHGLVHTGRLGWVGADFLDLEDAERGSSSATRTVRLGAVQLVRLLDATPA